MSKKATLKDVAREAGVSVATVSYIMNNRTDQKISDATRKKVLQIANLLDYTPNSTAKSLATGRNNLIGIGYHTKPLSPCRSMEVSSFIDMLTSRFHRLGYDTILFSSISEDVATPFHHNVDAIITIDLPQEVFARLADNSFVPIIGVDMLIHDQLFYQIYSNFPALIQQAKDRLGADFWLVLDPCSNEKYYQFILGDIPMDRVLTLSECTPDRLTSLCTEKVLALGSYVGMILQNYIPSENLVVISSDPTETILPLSCTVIQNDVVKKANVTVNIILNAMDKKFDVAHDLKI